MRIRSVLIGFLVLLIWSCSDFDEQKFIVDDIYEGYFSLTAEIRKDSITIDTVSNIEFGIEVKKLYPDSIFIKPISENRDFVELFPNFRGNSKMNLCYDYFYDDRLDSTINNVELTKISQYFKRRLVQELSYGRGFLGEKIQGFAKVEKVGKLSDLDESNHNLVYDGDTLLNYNDYSLTRPFNLGDCYVNKDNTRVTCFSIHINRRNGELDYYGAFSLVYQFGKWRSIEVY